RQPCDSRLVILILRFQASRVILHKSRPRVGLACARSEESEIQNPNHCELNCSPRVSTCSTLSG
ncbi:hypothetical protein Dimus_004475, partial [Dionaea muscipula]